MSADSIPSPAAVVYSVSELTGKIKQLLEINFSFIWIFGEISNISIPLSGHCYFTLKDDQAQINAVMFRSQHGRLKFRLENGMAITGLGRLSIFEPRGTYQIILEHVEPKGAGALQAAFEQLKKKLAAEGLFDQDRKKPLPYLPRRIAVVCSPTGAVLHDILRVIERRFASVHVQIVPVQVQGEGAEARIVDAIDRVNRYAQSDLIILARGGGSLEDLQAFNTETLARAIARSVLPVISAVGHETDYTIADFVADLRAPTPSAAAELAVPLRSDLVRRCFDLTRGLLRAVESQRRNALEKVSAFSQRLKSPRQVIDDARLKTDDLVQRLATATHRRIAQQREQVQWRTAQLCHVPFVRDCQYIKEKVYNYRSNLLYQIKIITEKNKGKIEGLIGRMEVLNPGAVLERGYSITRTLPDGRILKDPSAVRPGRLLAITLAKGTVNARVDSVGTDSSLRGIKECHGKVDF